MLCTGSIRRSITLTVMIALGPVAPSLADWRRVDTPNFVVMGDLAGGDLKTVAKKFEGFRETLSRALREDATATAVPTIVIVFPSDRAFTPFKLRYQGKPIQMSGVFVGRQDVNYIGLVYGGEDSLRTVFHEYAHLVISNTTRNIPVWLNEGLAEYFSTYEEGANGREALIGRAVSHHLVRLNDTRLLPLTELRQVEHGSPQFNERDRRSVFYAQSWALAHLLRIGLPDRTRALVTYLSRLEDGRSETEAWDEAFGSDNLDQALKAYIGQASFRAMRYTFRSKLSTMDPPVQAVSLGDAEARLADFLMRMQRPDEAADRLALASKAGAAGPAFTTAMAALDLVRRDQASAEQRLLGLQGVEDWLTAYFAGVVLADVSNRQSESGQDDRIAAARRLFEVVRASRGELPNVAALEASLALRQQVVPPATVRTALERARTLVPGRDDYALLHAQILARQSAFVAARSLLGALMSNAYPPQVRERARSLSTYVASLERYASRNAANRPSPAANTTDSARDTPAATTGMESRESVFVPTFRRTEAGERRIEGLLQRIECTARSVTFHLQAAEGNVRASASSLSNVELITYRDDVTGNVTCGPLASPMRVYVTVRTAAAGADPGTVVAVEYLPK